MSEVPVLTAFLACAVPLAALFVVFKTTLAAAWNGPLARRLRNSHWSVQVAALFAVALVTAHGGGKGDGGTNTLVAVSGGETNAVDASARATDSTESATVDAQAIAAMVEDLQDAEITRLGLDPDGAEAVALLSGGAIVPAWYLYSRTDTDQDGIPDLWETWTRGNPLDKYDGVLDLDDDGLNALYEFWNQTDPRTADTDGDGFDDGFESSFDPPVSNINPIVKADFTPVEPDADTNGVIDLWEGSGLLYGFQDANADGFDDTYAATLLPAASASNFDVLVDARTSRSAALTWEGTNGSGGIVLLATAGTTVRLRLPFGADTALRFLPAPEGTDPPAGQLWKSRLRLSFAPRAGQTLVGSCVVASDGAIAQRSVVSEAAVLRFPDGDGAWPGILVLERRFGIVPSEEYYHSGGDVVGPFVVTNTVNVNAQAARWSASDGTMFPTNGPSSALTVTTPEGNGPIFVTARIELDGIYYAEETATVWHCPYQDFSLDSVTGNFSPHLGETNVVSVTLPGCRHGNDPGWLECEVMRETTVGWQHVAWVDMDDSTPGVDRYGAATNLPHEASFAWDGRAQVGLDLADHSDVFTGPKGSFHRAMPIIEEGKPVPPPFYTLFARLWNDGKDVLLAEETRRFFVPQVVNLIPFGGETTFQQPVCLAATNGSAQVVLYPGCTEATAGAMIAQLPAMAMAFLPSDVNLRIVMTNGVVGGHKSMVIVGETSQGSKRGDNSGFRKRNCDPYGEMAIYVASFQKALQKSYDRMLAGNNDTIPVPMTPEQFAKCIAPTVAHEVGHSVGLVDPDWLDASPDDKQRNHNRVQTWVKMMDKGGLYYIKHRLNPHPTDYWRPDNLRYLRFVLPKGD